MLDIMFRSWINLYECKLFFIIFVIICLQSNNKNRVWKTIELYILCVLLLRYYESSDFYEDYYDSDIDIHDNQESWVYNYDSDGRDLTDIMSYCFI